MCGCLSCTLYMHPLLGTWAPTQACALTESQIADPLLCRQALNPLSHTCQGSWSLLKGEENSPSFAFGRKGGMIDGNKEMRNIYNLISWKLNLMIF